MKKFVLLFMIISCQSVNTFAQKKSSGMLGLGLDIGGGVTFVGPSYRSYFSENIVGQGEVLFGAGATLMSGFYQYRGDFPTAKSFKWYVGGGPSILMGNGATFFSYVRWRALS